ncbi:hypothetical protein SPE_0693 [Spiroplasma eriocheiris CCTCC M 207170]|nr:hypothetical protein SPE_0693 [Spiroplasma eriocheiris CCTCC M 207170]
MSGSKLTSSSPNLIAGSRVLHRLLFPRHSPYALCNFKFDQSIGLNNQRFFCFENHLQINNCEISVLKVNFKNNRNLIVNLLYK